jgi:hypothetical protein
MLTIQVLVPLSVDPSANIECPELTLTPIRSPLVNDRLWIACRGLNANRHG